MSLVDQLGKALRAVDCDVRPAGDVVWCWELKWAEASRIAEVGVPPVTFTLPFAPEDEVRAFTFAESFWMAWLSFIRTNQAEIFVKTPDNRAAVEIVMIRKARRT